MQDAPARSPTQPLANHLGGAYNKAVNPSRPHPPCRPPGLDPALLGTACCVLSALSYTAANICLRKLAVLEADEMWVTCMKEVVTVAVIGPWILLRACRGHPVLPPPRLLVALILTGLAVQLAGNLSVQWALGVVGLAITLSAIFGVMLAAAALFGEQMEGWLEANPRVGGYEIHYSATDLEPYSVSVWLEDAEAYGTDGDTCPIFPTKNEARARAVVAVAERLGELIDGSARKETKDDDDPVV